VKGKRPLYARVLRLQHIRPGGLLCFAFFEGSIGVGILLALAELAPWWAALVLPLVVAGMVKVNDVVAGLSARARLVPAHARAGTGRRVAVPRARPADTPPPTSRIRARGRASAPGAAAPDALPAADSPGRLPGLGLTPPVGHIYRHVPDDEDAGEGSADQRRGLNQRRFDPPA
jgi:hypothetical protein